MSLGTAPLMVKDIAGHVALRRPDAGELNVVALDWNGYPAEKVGTADDIELKPETLYYFIRK
jgi:hypothetical protein